MHQHQRALHPTLPPVPPPPGDVINHGKHDFWGKSGVHYHQGMKVGAGLAHRFACTGMPLVLIDPLHGFSHTRTVSASGHSCSLVRACPDLPAPRPPPQAGENTLNAICARLVVRTLARDGGWVGVGGLGAA